MVFIGFSTHAGASTSGLYSENLSYVLSASGQAIPASGGSAEDARLSLNFSVWQSDAKIVFMELTGGAIWVDDEEMRLDSGQAYYLVPFHQLRVYAQPADNATQNSTGAVKVAAIIDGRQALPGPGSEEDITLKIIGPPSRLASEWVLKMDGQVTLTAQPADKQKEKITLTTILNDNGDPERFHTLLNSALERLRERHPDIEIQLVEQQFPYPEARDMLIAAVSNETAADLVSIDQIWLGELAEKGMLADLTGYAKEWGKSSNWYTSNWDGGAYKGKTYAMWIWTDVRGIYYWKDLLSEAGVEPSTLQTWDGYLSAARTLNEKLGPQGIEGVHLTGASHSPDLWYPYLWMLGGDIVEQRNGHPERGVYWFPSYNSSEGVQALTFIRDQVDSGIKPQTEHYWGEEFHDRKFAVMIEASHVPGYFQLDPRQVLDQVGFIPMFPVPNGTVQTTTLMGGWELGIPATSKHKDLSWELITLMAEPEILSPWLAKYNYLPTQLPIGEGPYADQLAETNPFFGEMASEIQYGRSRPSIPEYPMIAEHIQEAINAVYSGSKDPKQALDDAAEKSAQALGWSNASDPSPQ